MFWSCFLFTLLLSHKVLFHWFSLCVRVCVCVCAAVVTQVWWEPEGGFSSKVQHHSWMPHTPSDLPPRSARSSHLSSFLRLHFSSTATSSVFITSQNRLQWHRDQLDCETSFEWALACCQNRQESVWRDERKGTGRRRKKYKAGLSERLEP